MQKYNKLKRKQKPRRTEHKREFDSEKKKEHVSGV